MKRFAQIGLGILILTQLVHVFASNVLWLARRNETSVMLEAIAWPTDRYADLTGQAQGWSQYSPRIPHQTVFAMVEWRNADGSPDKVMVSEREPADPARYIHWPGNRLACYEASLLLPLASFDDTVLADPAGWRNHLKTSVQQRRRMIEAYLRWRSVKSPGWHSEPVSSLVLFGRIYRPSPPGAVRAWLGPELAPLARRRIDAAGRVAVDYYDPFAERFVEMDSHE